MQFPQTINTADFPLPELAAKQHTEKVGELYAKLVGLRHRFPLFDPGQLASQVGKGWSLVPLSTPLAPPEPVQPPGGIVELAKLAQGSMHPLALLAEKVLPQRQMTAEEREALDEFTQKAMVTPEPVLVCQPGYERAPDKHVILYRDIASSKDGRIHSEMGKFYAGLTAGEFRKQFPNEEVQRRIPQPAPAEQQAAQSTGEFARLREPAEPQHPEPQAAGAEAQAEWDRLPDSGYLLTIGKPGHNWIIRLDGQGRWLVRDAGKPRPLTAAEVQQVWEQNGRKPVVEASDGDVWHVIEKPLWINGQTYRLQPLPAQYVPWTTPRECVGMVVQHKGDDKGAFVIQAASVNKHGVMMVDVDGFNYSAADLLSTFEQLDQTPCGTPAGKEESRGA